MANHVLMYFEIKKVMTVLIIFLILFSISSIADEYTIEINKNTPRVATVTATLYPSENLVLMNDEGVHGLENGWATFVENLKVVDSSNQLLSIRNVPNSRWDLTGYNGGEVTLTYRVKLGHDLIDIKFGDNGAAYATDAGVMWAGRALFIAGKPSADVTVTFDLPKSWKVTTPWESIGDHGFRFKVLNTSDLQNSAFFAGTHRSYEFTDKNATLRMALSGESTLEVQEEIVDNSNQFFKQYEGTYRSSVSSNMLIIAADRESWGGEVMGRAISLSIGDEVPPGFNPVNILSQLVGHEMFHMFSLRRLEVDEEALSDGHFEWFNEGFGAEYGTNMARIRMGEMSEAEWYAELQRNYDKYRKSLDGTVTIRSSGSEKHKYYDTAYSGGLIVAATLDFAIRDEFNGEKTLDDLWVYLLNKYPVGGAPLTLDHLISASKELYGTKISQLLERCINSTEPVPFMQYAESMGLILSSEKLIMSKELSSEPKSLWNYYNQ
jgi:predicted metalloprotease with PDZ domain